MLHGGLPRLPQHAEEFLLEFVQRCAFVNSFGNHLLEHFDGLLNRLGIQDFTILSHRNATLLHDQFQG